MKFGSGEHIAVLGMNGSGKTYWCRGTLIPLWSRVIVVDTEEYDYNRLPAVSPSKAVALARSKNKAFRVRVVFRGDGGEKDASDLNALCGGLLRGGHNTLIVFDEITDFCDAQTIPPSLRSIVRKARKRNITVAMATQRPAMLSKDAYTQSVHRVVFYLPDYDCAAIKKYAPWAGERMSQIPYKSYRYLYQAPSGEVIVMEGEYYQGVVSALEQPSA